jgi:CRISPR system Cascade subunit CasD
MTILLLRLAGPMQSWGTQSRFTNRDTGLEPSKSGVIGLLCAALGKPRNEDSRSGLPSLEELAKLKMGVRVDWPGTVERDYQTAQNVARAGGGIKDCELSERFYLADAFFLVVLQGDIQLLEKLHHALQNPVWQLYLGRKAFVPGLPVWLRDGLRPDNDLESALKSYPHLCPDREDAPDELRLELEVDYGKGDRVRYDQPESFVSAERRFGPRHVRTDWVHRSELPRGKEEELCISLS